MIKSYSNWLLEGEDSERSVELATDPNTPAETLAQLAQREDWVVLTNVAQNPNTPAEALVHLARAYSWLVLYRVVQHPNAPDEALYLLSKDTDSYIREAAREVLKPRQDQEMKSWGWDQEAIDLIRQLGI